jgi:hypothetical protein
LEKQIFRIDYAWTPRWLGRFNSIDSEKPDTWVYLNRIRYLPRLDVPLSEKMVPSPVMMKYSLALEKMLAKMISDQNRIALMAGCKFNPNLRIEAGLHNHQIVMLRYEK